MSEAWPIGCAPPSSPPPSSPPPSSPPPSSPPPSSPPPSSGNCGAAAWKSNQAYVSGDKVTYNGHEWTANQWNYDEVPRGAGRRGAAGMYQIRYQGAQVW